MHSRWPRDRHPLPHVPVPVPGRATGAIGPAWIVREVTHVPGVLRLADGRLSFVSSRGTVFDVALADAGGPAVDLTVPWHGRGFHLTVADERLRVHVVRPPGAVGPGPGLVSAVARGDDVPGTRGDAAAAVAWRALLVSAEAPRPRRPAARRAVRSRRGSGGPALRS